MLDQPFFKKPIEFVKGVGPLRAELLAKELSVFTVGDLIEQYPFRYEDRSTMSTIADISNEKLPIQFSAKIVDLHVTGRGRGKRLLALAEDEGGEVELVWFKSIDWIKKNIKIGEEYLVYGKPSRFKNKYNIVHPELKLLKETKLTTSHSIIPVYSSTETLNRRGIDNKARVKMTRAIIKEWSQNHIPEYLPSSWIKKLGFLSPDETIKNIHFPKSAELLEKASNRIKFEELFFLVYTLLGQNYHETKKLKGEIFATVGDKFNDYYKKHLPFQLTNAQKRVIKEIRKDLGTGIQMNRLLQGDVGSGKTIVAFLSMLIALDNGYQSAIMAPTEILAQQHFSSLQQECEKIGVRIALLTGSVKGAQRKEILRQLRLGEIDILIGTHALIEAPVRFDRLGLVVIDEQHRFGVEQRAKLWLKNDSTPPHILVMTATPIPRTLQMTVYADLDVSKIDELPPSRKPIKTVHKTIYDRGSIIEFMKEQIAEGRQIYVVYPLIEESSALDLKDLSNGYNELLEQLPRPDYQIGIVHGRMKPEDKEMEMKRFSEGKTQILVATTVIEVGVNVPNASVMIIENAERFGLAQLHQLRGRVGRGSAKSYCVLVTKKELSRDANTRISTMCQTQDGFLIAEVDLQLRGPGNIAGKLQSGRQDFKLANLIDDQGILTLAKRYATALLETDPYLEKKEYAALKSHIQKNYNHQKLWSRIS